VVVGTLVVRDQRTFCEFAWARRDQTSVVAVESMVAVANVRSMESMAARYNLVEAILGVVLLEVVGRILRVEEDTEQIEVVVDGDSSRTQVGMEYPEESLEAFDEMDIVHTSIGVGIVPVDKHTVIEVENELASEMETEIVPFED
jgi:hypothetical protein